MQNEFTNIPKNENNPEGGYTTRADLLEVVLTSPKDGERGMDLSTMLDRAPILKKIRNTTVGDDFNLNAEELVQLKNLFEPFKGWARHFDAIVNIGLELRAEIARPRGPRKLDEPTNAADVAEAVAASKQ